MRASYSAILPPEHPSYPSRGMPLEHKPDHITCQLKTLQCLPTDLREKTKAMKVGWRARRPTLRHAPLSLSH